MADALSRGFDSRQCGELRKSQLPAPPFRFPHESPQPFEPKAPDRGWWSGCQAGPIVERTANADRDARRDAKLRSLGYRLLRIPAYRVHHNPSAAVSDIQDFLR